MATIGELRWVSHCVFGLGVVFGNRITDSGEAADTWFLRDERLRTVLIETLAECAEPAELSKAQRKAARAAVAEYRKTHRKRVRQTADRPRLRRSDSKPEWRRTFSFPGREDELAPAAETEEAVE
jgi:hypothetical protein